MAPGKLSLRSVLNFIGPVLGLIFVIAGKGLLNLLGVGVPDFLVAGGLVLLALAIIDIVAGGGHEARGSVAQPDFGAVPIGTPILAGPATLATLLVLVSIGIWLVTTRGRAASVSP